jgi:hypothetical protein
MESSLARTRAYTNVSSLTFNSTSAMLHPDSGNCSVTCLGIILLTAHGSNICSWTCDNFAEPLHWKKKKKKKKLNIKITQYPKVLHTHMLTFTWNKQEHNLKLSKHSGYYDSWRQLLIFPLSFAELLKAVTPCIQKEDMIMRNCCATTQSRPYTVNVCTMTSVAQRVWLHVGCHI